MLVAQGAGESMIDHGLHPWDVAALKPIVDEAGGLLTNWDGGFSIHRSDVVGSNRLIHTPSSGVPRGMNESGCAVAPLI